MPSSKRRSQQAALDDAALAARAADVLRANDLGTMVTAAPRLYPHMWSWDAAFIAVGLASLSVSRAMTEIDTLLAAQWRTGKIPHIVFSPGSSGYFPGPDRWACSQVSLDAPRAPQTSGICQPPVHALAVDRILEAAAAGTPEEQEQGRAFLDRAWPRLLAWHRWLGAARDPSARGRVTIHHGWESGMDNSPRWDGPYSRVRVGDLPPYTRLDTRVVEDGAQRPTDAEYDRYLWLLQEMRDVGYDDRRIAEVGSFAVEDVFFSAILSAASDVLADLGQRHGKPRVEVAEMRDLADRFRAGVRASVDPATGLARDHDLRSGEWLESRTIAGFAALLCGADAEAEEATLSLFFSADWCGHPSFAAALPPSTSPASDSFRPTTYWRGPQWPVLAWLFHWAFRRHGFTAQADQLRREALRLLAGGEFGEYYQPFTGEPLGSQDQSWTAAVVLDWLSRP